MIAGGQLLRSSGLHSARPVSSCTAFHKAACSPARSCLGRQSHLNGPFRLNAAAAVDAEPLDAAAPGYASFALDSQMTWPSRSHGAGALTAADAGKEVTVCGWVDRNRNLGGLGFMDVRDHTGLLQVRLSQHTITSKTAALRHDSAPVSRTYHEV
jgi:aspartyl-tRNA synthetase